MRSIHLFLFGMLIVMIVACTEKTAEQNTEDETTSEEEMRPEVTALPLVEKIEAAHEVSQFKQKDAVQFDIELFFGGSKRLEGVITSTTNSTRVKVEKANGQVIGYDGQQVWMSPADAQTGGARFDIFTWQYFFMAPFKFSDPGANWESLEDMMLDGEAHATAKLTFDAGTGDAPDDWYIAYKDKSTDMLDALAYIVTFGKTQEKAEEEPHAITYHNYEEVEGVPIAKKWKFWLWTEEKGVHQQLGEANISNVKFVKVNDADFQAPESSQEVSR